MKPHISVVMPAYNEGARLAETIRSIARARRTDARIEFVIADDHSSDDTESHLRHAWPTLRKEPAIDIRVSRLDTRVGVPRARNHAAAQASADLLFITDAHVRFSNGWDERVFALAHPRRVLAGAITEASTPFVGYGCQLVVPFMGTYWNKEPVDAPRPVQIAACPATVLPRALYAALGGYDEGMLMYGSAEPEFSVRAWLAGAEILLVPDLRVEHRFKPNRERQTFIHEVRACMVHNGLRFGLLYLGEAAALQMLRYYTCKFPNLFDTALQRVAAGDVFARRLALDAQGRRPFSWFVNYFGLKDQAGGEIL